MWEYFISFLDFMLVSRGACEISSISWSHFLYTFCGPKNQMKPSKVEVMEKFFLFLSKNTFILGTRLWFQSFFYFHPDPWGDDPICLIFFE